jgi:hypothetical protein
VVVVVVVVVMVVADPDAGARVGVQANDEETVAALHLAGNGHVHRTST